MSNWSRTFKSTQLSHDPKKLGNTGIEYYRLVLEARQEVKVIIKRMK